MSEGQGDHAGHTEPLGSAQCENRASCDKRVCDKDRRRLLGALATGGALSLAGCTALFVSETEEPAETEYDVRYAQQGKTIQVGESQTLLGAGEDAGMDLPFDCRAGFCGTCLARANGDATDLVDMVVNDYGPLNEAAVRAGYFLPCTSHPETHLEMDTSVGAADLQQFQEDDDDDDGDDGDNGDNGDDDGQTGTQTFHTVTYVNEQWSIEVPEDQSLLVAGEERGLDLPFQCRVGRCGHCLAWTDADASELVEMTANNYDPLDEEAIQNGYFLTCTGQPRDDLSLESGRYGELEE